MKTAKIHYQKEASSGFYNTLRKKVNDSLLNCENTTCYLPAVKSFVLLLFYSCLLILIFKIHDSPGILFSYILLGVLTTGIFLNIVHDAAHNALFKNQTWNTVAIHLLELFGTDSYIWKKRHIVSHHSYPNIYGKDLDIRQSNLVRILPNSPFLAHHCYQPYYVPLIYFLYTLNWFFHRDLVDAFRYSEALHVSNTEKIENDNSQNNLPVFIYCSSIIIIR